MNVKIIKYSESPRNPKPNVETIEPKRMLLKISMFKRPKYLP